MNEIRAIADQLARAHDGEAWYGDPTMAVLRGVTAEQASRRPVPRAHTVWEIVLHMTSWQREVLRRLRTRVAREPEDGDWPPPPTRPTRHGGMRWSASKLPIATSSPRWSASPRTRSARKDFTGD
jgi:hypothetical protein